MYLASERDTYRGNTIENWGYEFVYIYVWTYVCHFLLWPSRIFVFALCSTPSQTESSGLAIITLITLEIELFTALNCFAGAVKTQKLMGAPFLFKLVAVES